MGCIVQNLLQVLEGDENGFNLRHHLNKTIHAKGSILAGGFHEHLYKLMATYYNFNTIKISFCK